MGDQSLVEGMVVDHLEYVVFKFVASIKEEKKEMLNSYKLSPDFKVGGKSINEVILDKIKEELERR